MQTPPAPKTANTEYAVPTIIRLHGPSSTTIIELRQPVRLESDGLTSEN